MTGREFSQIDVAHEFEGRAGVFVGKVKTICPGSLAIFGHLHARSVVDLDIVGCLLRVVCSEGDGFGAVGSICSTDSFIHFEREGGSMVACGLVAVVGIVDSQFAIGIGHRVIDKLRRVSTFYRGRRIEVILTIHILHIKDRLLLYSGLGGICRLESSIELIRRAVRYFCIRKISGDSAWYAIVSISLRLYQKFRGIITICATVIGVISRKSIIHRNGLIFNLLIYYFEVARIIISRSEFDIQVTCICGMIQRKSCRPATRSGITITLRLEIIMSDARIHLYRREVGSYGVIIRIISIRY